METTYKEEYKEFISSYISGVTNGEAVGKQVARLAQYYADANTIYGIALTEYNKIASIIESTTDGDSNKPISSAKAKILSAATPESNRLIFAKIDIENIEQMLNALKTLQKGVLKEQDFVGNM